MRRSIRLMSMVTALLCVAALAPLPAHAQNNSG